ncbi:unnamed protein product [Amoebophrya sp. A120]|nr:unnamed protein product [Amoebophrya sp. A120]|eukprot:GSA120T00025586001.1
MLSSGGTVGELDAAGDQKSKNAAFGLKRDVKLPPLQLKNICPPEFVQELNKTRQSANLIQKNIDLFKSEDCPRPQTRQKQLQDKAVRRKSKLIATRARKIQLLSSEYTRTLRLYEETLRRALQAEERKKSPRRDLYSAAAMSQMTMSSMSPRISTRGGPGSTRGSHQISTITAGGHSEFDQFPPTPSGKAKVSGIGKLGVDPRGQGMHFIKFSDENQMLCGWMRIVAATNALTELTNAVKYKKERQRQRLLDLAKKVDPRVWIMMQIKGRVLLKRRKATICAQALRAWKPWRFLWFSTHRFLGSCVKIQQWWRVNFAWHEKAFKQVSKRFLVWEKKFLAEKIRQQEYAARKADQQRGGSKGRGNKTDQIAEMMAKAEAKARASMSMDEKTAALLMAPKEREDFVRKDLYTRRFLAVHGEGRVMINEYLKKRRDYYASKQAMKFLGQSSKGVLIVPLRPFLPSYLPREDQIAELVSNSMKALAELRKMGPAAAKLAKERESESSRPTTTSGHSSQQNTGSRPQTTGGSGDHGDNHEKDNQEQSQPTLQSQKSQQLALQNAKKMQLSEEEKSSTIRVLDGGLRLFNEFGKQVVKQPIPAADAEMFLTLSNPFSGERGTDIHRLGSQVKEAAMLAPVGIGAEKSNSGAMSVEKRISIQSGFTVG